jgi:hypothetical protein
VVGRTHMRRSLAVPIATLLACPARWCSRGEAWVRVAGASSGQGGAASMD